MEGEEKSTKTSEKQKSTGPATKQGKSDELMDVGHFADNDFLRSLILKHHKKGKGLPLPCKTQAPARSEVLDRVKAFLPIMRAEQVQLEERVKNSKDAVNMEHIDDEQDQHIEMDIQLFEDDSGDSSEDSSSSEDEDTHESCQCPAAGEKQSGLLGEVTESNIQIHKRGCHKHKPRIEVISIDSDGDPDAVQIIEPEPPEVISIDETDTTE